VSVHVGLAAALAVLPAATKAPDECATKACVERVEVRQAHERWRDTVRRYGRGLLLARMRCESGSHGGYRLSTTTGLYWFAHQFNVGAWTGAGGRVRFGRPVGVWSLQPERLEQDYRAARWDALSGGDPWPNCP
jgi:hypothetical protein